MNSYQVDPRSPIPLYWGMGFALGFLSLGLIFLLGNVPFEEKVGNLLLAFGFSVLWAWSCLGGSKANRAGQVSLLLLQAAVTLLLAPLWLGSGLASVQLLGAIGMGFFYGFSMKALYGVAGIAVGITITLTPNTVWGYPWETLTPLFLLVGILHGAQHYFHRRFSRVQSEKRLSEPMARMGLLMNSTIHDWEGRVSLHKNLLELLSVEFAQAQNGKQEAWVKIHNIVELLNRTAQESRDWGKNLRKAFIGSTPPGSDPPGGNNTFSLEEFCRSWSEPYRLGTCLRFDIQHEGVVTLSETARLPFVIILDSLCNNAREAEATMFAIAWEVKEGKLSLTVANDGLPLKDCDHCQRRICNPISCGRFQLGKSDKAQGTGTGMTAVLEALRLLNGSISLRTTLERTSFTLSFPKLLAHRSSHRYSQGTDKG